MPTSQRYAADPGACNAAPRAASGAPARTRRSSSSASRVGRSCVGSTPRCPGPIRPTARRPIVAQCLEEMATRRKVPLGDRTQDRTGRPDRRDQPVARRRLEPRPARLLARSRLPGPGPDDRGRRRVTDYAFRELGWPHLWLSNAAGESCLAPDQGEAGRHGWSI